MLDCVLCASCQIRQASNHGVKSKYRRTSWGLRDCNWCLKSRACAFAITFDYKEWEIDFAIVWTPTENEDDRIRSELYPFPSINHVAAPDERYESRSMIIPIVVISRQHDDIPDGVCVSY